MCFNHNRLLLMWRESELLLFVMIETHTEKRDWFEGMMRNDVLKTQWGVLEKGGLIVWDGMVS